jgi:hypothetical protein
MIPPINFTAKIAAVISDKELLKIKETVHVKKLNDLVLPGLKSVLIGYDNSQMPACPHR